LKFKFLDKFSYIWLQKQLEKILGLPPDVTVDKLEDVHDAIEDQWEEKDSGLKVVKIISSGITSIAICKNGQGKYSSLFI